MVAAGDPQTVDAGVGALRAGGNAIDAAVAAAFAAFVCEVPLCSPLGGGVMLVRLANGESHALDLFARTPGLGGRPRELDFGAISVEFEATTQVFHGGRASAAVPLGLPGLVAAHERWGRLPLSEVAARGVALGRDGYTMSDQVAFICSLLMPIARASTAATALYQEHRNEAMAQVLEDVARAPDALRDLYAQLVREFGPATGGLISEADVADLRPADLRPVTTRIGPWTLRSMPGPSTGGVLVALAVRMLQGVAERAPFLSPAHLSEVARIQHRLHGVRHPGFDQEVRDPAFVEELLANPPSNPGSPTPEHPLGSTTHISVLDGEGAAVGLTLTNGEGCGHVLTGTGIQVNNLLGEEDIHPRGFHADPPGYALSTMMAPTIAVHEAGDELVLGSGGSNRLRNAISMTLSHVLEYGVSIREAVDAPRLHLEVDADGHQLAYEREGMSEAAAAALEAAWRRTAPFARQSMYFGGVHTAAALGGRFAGAGDARRGGHFEVA